MRKFLIFPLLLGTGLCFAQQVKLKITYKDNPVAGHVISVMYGDAVIGKGNSDDHGEVTVKVASLVNKSIDLKGEKKCDGAEKSWKMKGYVTLDDNNYAHVKMDKIVEEAVSGSGGFMSEDMVAGSYGLVCGGTKSSSSNNKNESPAQSTNNNSSSSSSDVTPSSIESGGGTTINQKAFLENRIKNLNSKISKSEEKINSGNLEQGQKDDESFNIKEWQIEKKITQNKIDKIDLQNKKGNLSDEEIGVFNKKEEQYNKELEQVKNEHKTSKAAYKAEKKEDSIEVTKEEMDAMSVNQLKRKKMDLNLQQNKIQLKLKTRRNALSPDELNDLDNKQKKIEKSIFDISEEINKRENGAGQ